MGTNAGEPTYPATRRTTKPAEDARHQIDPKKETDHPADHHQGGIGQHKEGTCHRADHPIEQPITNQEPQEDHTTVKYHPDHQQENLRKPKTQEETKESTMIERIETERTTNIIENMNRKETGTTNQDTETTNPDTKEVPGNDGLNSIPKSTEI